jgi:hypothetical protein
MRRVIALIVVLVAALPLHAAHASDPAASDGTGPLDTTTDLDAALRFEALIPEHTFGGMVTPLYYDEWPHIDPNAAPLRIDAAPDSGNYTGVYLAAQSWRLTQATKELATLDPESDAAAFWQAQHDEALVRASEIARYYHVLVNIASAWQTELDPQIGDDPNQVGWIDFGGGIVPGEAGLLMRTCTRATDPAVANLRDWADEEWWCMGATSRDSYAGTLFGLAVAMDLLGAEDPELRTMLAADLMAMTDYAAKYLWNQPRPHGMIANPVLDQNDLEGPISPLFIQVPLHKLHLIQTARHAANLIGDDDAALRYEALWQAEVAVSVANGALLDSMVIDAAAPHSTQYKYQLHLMSFFNVIRLESDPIVREELMRAMGVLDATLTDDGNAFYEAITFALTGETQRLDEAVALHREWLDYYAFHEEWARRAAVDDDDDITTPFRHIPRCTITGEPDPDAPLVEQPLECVPKDQVDMVVTLPTGEEVETPFRPGTDTNFRAKDPLPVGVRRLADFLWQKDPTVVGGDHDVPWRGPSIDFLGTYWMLRYFSEVEVPAVHPLPAWAGPRWT